MTQTINTADQVLEISLKDIGFLNVGSFDVNDNKTIDSSGYGCPECNGRSGNHNNRLETQEDGTFWCNCCGVVWELYDTSKVMSTTQKIKYIKTHKADPIFAAILEAQKQEHRGTELTYCPVCDTASYWGAYGGSMAGGVVFCDYCDQQYDLEREESSTGEYHGSASGFTNPRLRMGY